MLSCAFIGYQSDDYFFNQNEQHPLCVMIKRSISEQAKAIYARGARRFYVGGALGADMWAGEAIHKLKAQTEYADIELACLYPFEGHCRDWNDADTARFERILAACTDKYPVNPSNTPAAYQKRYRAMIDSAQIVIAVCRGGNNRKSDTDNAVEYAKKHGKEIILIHPDTAEVILP